MNPGFLSESGIRGDRDHVRVIADGQIIIDVAQAEAADFGLAGSEAVGLTVESSSNAPRQSTEPDAERSPWR